MSRLTTHLLDLFHGRPAEGVRLRLFRSETKELLGEWRTDETGRAICDPTGGKPLGPGRYDLVFTIGAYFAAAGVALADPPFLEEIVIRFGMGGTSVPYHIPLLVTPWSYTTYRGQ